MTNEELQQQIEQLEQQIKDLKVKLESKADKKPYKVEVPEDLEDYYFIDESGNISLIKIYSKYDQKRIFIRGLAFKTREEAEQFDKERILINKFKDWAKKYNEGWTPNWVESEDKFHIDYHYGSKCFQVKDAWHANAFHKLPYLKSEEIARKFIEEFGDEIKEVLY